MSIKTELTEMAESIQARQKRENRPTFDILGKTINHATFTDTETGEPVASALYRTLADPDTKVQGDFHCSNWLFKT